jgi:hypothetical protein
VKRFTSGAAKTEPRGALREERIQEKKPGQRKSWQQRRLTRQEAQGRNKNGREELGALPRAEQKSDEAMGAETRSKEKPAGDGRKTDRSKTGCGDGRKTASKTDRTQAAAMDEKQPAETKTRAEQEDLTNQHGKMKYNHERWKFFSIKPNMIHTTMEFTVIPPSFNY